MKLGTRSAATAVLATLALAAGATSAQAVTERGHLHRLLIGGQRHPARRVHQRGWPRLRLRDCVRGDEHRLWEG